MSLVLRALEGFNKLPRDIRMYVLALMIGPFNLASCYFAVFDKRKPNYRYAHDAALHGWTRDEWIDKYAYSIACGSAEGGHVDLWDRLPQHPHIDGVIDSVNCHPKIWNMITTQDCLKWHSRLSNLLLTRVKNGWPLTGLLTSHHPFLTRGRINIGASSTTRLVINSQAYIVMSTVQWLIGKVSLFHIALAIYNLDAPDLMQIVVDNGGLRDVRRLLINESKPNLFKWYSAMMV
jgi:hypothetical protein